MAQPPSISTKPASSRVEAFKNWLKLKHYQFEVTFSVYTFTRGEKVFFYMVLLLLISLTLAATILYLPRHVRFVISRAWYYIHGEAPPFGGAESDISFLATTAKRVMDSAAAAVEKAAAAGRREL